MSPWFTARQQFDRTWDGWEKYLAFAKIPRLIEVVGLDSSLCPSVIEEFEEEDLEFVSEIQECGAFTNLEYLLQRIEGVSRRNVLAVISDPVEHIERLMEPGFSFAGYELLEDQTGISALTNCGGFPKAFSNDELNEVGLLADFARAQGIQRALREYYPDEPHADTMLYAIWRFEGFEHAN